MAVLRDYDAKVQNMNNLPGYDKVNPTSYQQRKYKEAPINKWGDDQCEWCEYNFRENYLEW